MINFAFVQDLFTIKKIFEYRYLWADIVKGHPLFLDPPSKLRCYVNLFEWSELIQTSEKTAFCDACYKLMPDLTQKTLWGLDKLLPSFCQDLFESSL